MTDKPAESAVERYCATKADTLFNKYGEAYEVVPRQRADAALTEVQDERDAALKRERVATMFSDAFEDAANGAHWRLEYERGLRHVILSCWQYASRADEAWENGYQKGWLDGEGQYEPLLTKADAALADVVDALAELQAKLAAAEAALARANTVNVDEVKNLMLTRNGEAEQWKQAWSRAHDRAVAEAMKRIDAEAAFEELQAQVEDGPR